MTDGQEIDVTMEQIVLGTLVLKFSLPMILVDQLNEICDTVQSKKVAFNDQLAGKIENEYALTQLLSDETKEMFLGFFKEYMKRANKGPCGYPFLMRCGITIWWQGSITQHTSTELEPVI